MKKLKNRINFAFDYLKKRKRLESMPIEACIGLTNACNARCEMCPNRTSKRKIGFMPFSTFKKIIDQLKDHVEIVYLHSDGESLLHPKLFEMIKYSKQQGITTGLSTNAIVLDKEKSEKIIESGLDYFIISIDATSRKTYLKVKGVDKYDVVVDNVKHFLEIKQDKKPYTVVQLIEIKENSKEVRQFKQIWKSPNAGIRIRPAISWGGFYKNTTNNPLGPTKACILLWRMVVFFWDGTVAMCCHDILNSCPIGNINKNSIAEIWNGEKMMKYREMHIKKDYGKISLCKDCDVPAINLPFLAGSVLLDTFTIKKLIVKLEKIPYLRKYV